MAEETKVAAGEKETKLKTRGVDHITVWGSNAEDTKKFYSDLLGMSLVLEQPNLDNPDETHLFFDTGDGRILTFFVNDDRESDLKPQKGQVGSVHHLSFKINPEEFEDIKQKLEENGHHCNVFDRGIFHSIYTRDNNGLVVELSADKFEFPEEKRGEVLAKAQELREEDGEEYAKEKHIEEALEQLGIEAEKHELPDSPNGVGNI